MRLIDLAVGPASTGAEIEAQIADLSTMPQDDEGVMAALRDCRRYLERARVREQAAADTA